MRVLQALYVCLTEVDGEINEEGDGFNDGAADALTWALCHRPNAIQVARQLDYAEDEYDETDPVVQGGIYALRWLGEPSEEWRGRKLANEGAEMPDGSYPEPFPSEEPYEDPVPFGLRQQARVADGA